MSLKLEDVKGVGKKVDLLKDIGIDSVEKLANAKPEDLIEIKGIGKASAVELINKAKKLLNEKKPDAEIKKESTEEAKVEEEKIVQEEVKKLEEKRKQLEGKKVEEGDFILVKITGKTQKGKVFQVSSVDDAKKAGIYDEKRDQQGYYTPEFVIVGKPGFLNEGLTETLKEMKYFEKKSVRIPPIKAFGKRDPTKIERIGIAKFKKLNNGKNPELGQEFVKQSQQGGAQRGVVTSVIQGKVIVDYNHPLAGQNVDYNLEVIDKIEDFNDKIAQFMINKGIPKQSIKDFNMSYNPEKSSIEFTIPKMFLFQNLTYIKFGLAMDLQSYMGIGDVRFIEVYEKLPIPTASSESVMKKVEEFNKQEKGKEKEEKSAQEKE
jgi:FKBP-type peptidyl-prolyl cis-trans isomerase SlyD